MLNYSGLKKFGFSAILFSCLTIPTAFSQDVIMPKVTNYIFLRNNALTLSAKADAGRTSALRVAAQKGWELSRRDRNGNVMRLQRMDGYGMPVYSITTNNTLAALSTRTNQVYAGGSLGLSLNGSTIPNGKIAIWDGDAVLASHIEFAGGRIEVKDNTVTTSVHSTHVAGTMIAAGVNPIARGMAYGLPKLYAFNFDNDTPEMSANAAGLLISNHSYGTLAGWYLNTEVSPQRWEFYGAPDATEDYKFGYYDTEASDWDKICYNAPYYLPVKSVGNNRAVYGPAVGTTYYRHNASKVMASAGPRPEGISSNDGYDNIATYGTAKNILTIGAVNPVVQGLYYPANIQITAFSSWGPTDDGRIKPDLVADGIRVTSTGNAANNSYATLSGTSMATPNVSGSLILLQELYYQQNKNTYMRSATLKALAIGTAAEAGAANGPDYSYGWGLLNMEAAGRTLLDNGNKTKVTEQVLANGEQQYIEVIAAGDSPLKATLCWTDPEAAAIVSTSALNNSTIQLMNDLDLRGVRGQETFYPWVLDPANPSAAATTGDNKRDNVEQVVISDPVAGGIYRFKLTHKGALKRGSQPYSLVITGINGDAPFVTSKLTENEGLNFILYPVPAIKEINVNFNVAVSSDVQLRIINLTGQELYKEQKTSFSGIYYSQVNLSAFNSGLYIVQITIGGHTHSKKFVYTK